MIFKKTSNVKITEHFCVVNYCAISVCVCGRRGSYAAQMRPNNFETGLQLRMGRLHPFVIIQVRNA